MSNVILFLLLTLVSLQALGQKSADDITRKYNAFRKEYPSVKVRLVFNQYRFAPGDTVWFKAYFLNADNSLIRGRQLLDLSVVGSDGGVLQHFLFGVTDGIGFNQFVIPEMTLPGIYNVTAYSSWMMNFHPAPVFSKEIEVVGEKEIVAVQKTTHDSDFHLAVLPDAISFSAKEGSMLRYQDLNLVVTRADKILFVRPFHLGLKSSEAIPFDWSPGTVNISVIDKAGRVITSIAHDVPERDPVTVRIDAGEGFQTRTKSRVAVTIVDKSNNPMQGEFSLSALNLNKEKHDSVAGEPVYEPWHQIFSGRQGETRYAFTSNLFRGGTAYKNDGMTPVPAGTTIVFYLQNNDVILQATTMQGGKFTLPLRDINKGDEMIAIAESNGEPLEGLKITWEQNSIQLPPPPASHEGENEDAFGVFASTRKLIDKAFRFYGSEESTQPVRSVEPRSESFLEERIQVADHSVDVQKYVTFPTMEVLIREIVPSLQSRVVRGKSFVQVTLREPMPVAKAEPVFIIDGMVTNNTKFFLSLRPSDVATAKVVTSPAKLLPLGLIGKNGIVIVETVKGNARPPFDPWQIVEGINPAMTFKQASDKADARKPDLRSTIFWAPTVTTDANGKAVVEFVHSDDTGWVMIVVNGMTKDGKSFSGKASFKATLK